MSQIPINKPSDVPETVIRLPRSGKKYLHTINTNKGIECIDHKKICKALENTVYFANHIARDKMRH